MAQCLDIATSTGGICRPFHSLPIYTGHGYHLGYLDVSVFFFVKKEKESPRVGPAERRSGPVVPYVQNYLSTHRVGHFGAVGISSNSYTTMVGPSME